MTKIKVFFCDGTIETFDVDDTRARNDNMFELLQDDVVIAALSMRNVKYMTMQYYADIE